MQDNCRWLFYPELSSLSWTAADATVVCRDLGFKDSLQGFFTYNFTATEYHRYVAITKPECTGAENRLMDCPQADSPQYSSQICRE